jgi:hypothetical protein
LVGPALPAASPSSGKIFMANANPVAASQEQLLDSLFRSLTPDKLVPGDQGVAEQEPIANADAPEGDVLTTPDGETLAPLCLEWLGLL